MIMKSNLKFLILCLVTVFAITSCEKDETFKLNLAVSPENSGTVTGAGSYKSGEIVNITATANSGYLFLNWTKGDVVVGTDANFTYTTTAEDVTLTANFEKKIIVKLGAQSNATIGAFYALVQNIVYNQADAASHQDTIDMICFYEHDVANNRINDITLSSPGANITGIYGGTSTDPSNYTTKRTTLFTPPATAITTAQFDVLKQNDASIQTYFNSTMTSGNKKAKTLAVDNIYAFKTHDNIYGLFKVISVVQGADGYVEFELKLKK